MQSSKQTDVKVIKSNPSIVIQENMNKYSQPKKETDMINKRTTTNLKQVRSFIVMKLPTFCPMTPQFKLHHWIELEILHPAQPL